MQYFTFHRQADRLRADVRAWQIAVSAEATILLIMGLVVPRGNIYILLLTPCYFAFVWWLYSRPLRRRHILTETTLTLVDSSGEKLVIPRDRIRSVERYTDQLPHGIRPVTIKYVPWEDTVYMLPDKRSLVAVTLTEPVRGQLPPRLFVEFTRVVCQVDEPEAFIAAVLPGAGPAAQNEGDAAAVGVVGSEGASPEGLAATLFRGAAAAAGPAAIVLSGLTKRFGDVAAVADLNLQVAPGEIFAFLGSNGAGKSTTVRMMVGLLRPTGGRILIGGQDPWQDLAARRQVGYVPDSPMLYDNLTAREHLWLIGGLYGMAEPAARDRAAEVLRQVGLERHADQVIRSFSLGMKRKLAIAAALMHRPPVLLLDEATNGLDPRSAREVKDFLRGAARSGTTIFLTTHLLDVVSELADRVAIIDRGVLQACGTPAELRLAFGSPEGSLEDLFLLATDQARKEAVAQWEQLSGPWPGPAGARSATGAGGSAGARQASGWQRSRWTRRFGPVAAGACPDLCAVSASA